MPQERITGDELDVSAQQIVDDSDTMHSIVHGAEDDPDVPTEGGDVPPLAKVIALMQSFLGPGLISGTGAPDAAAGTDGMHYIDENSGELWKKAAGAWAVFHALESTRVYTAESKPSDDFGGDGDIALVSRGSYLYEIYGKDAGAWATRSRAFTPQDYRQFSLVENYLGGFSAELTSDGHVGETGQWFHVISGACKAIAESLTASDWTHGSLSLEVGATAGDACALTYKHASSHGFLQSVRIAYMLGNALEYKFRIKEVSLKCWLGYIDPIHSATNANVPRFIGIRADTSIAANFQVGTIMSGAEEWTDTGVPVDTAYHTISVHIEPTGVDTVIFKVDGVNTFEMANPVLSVSHDLGVLVESTGVAGKITLNEMRMYGQIP